MLTDFEPYEPLDDDDTFDNKYVVHSDGDYAAGDVHINTCKSHGSLLRPWHSIHHGI